MITEYDEKGNYKYPEGFDPETNEWRDGFDTERVKWEQDYAAAQARWEEHKKQVAAILIAEAALDAAAPASATADAAPTSFSSEVDNSGTLADDESLAALRDQLAGE